MESVGIPEEEVRLNTPVPAPHIITSSLSSPPLLDIGIKSGFQVVQVKIVRGKGRKRGGNKSCCVGKGGKHPRFICRGNYGVSWKS